MVVACTTTAAPQLTEGEQTRVRTLINLLDYVAKDYQLAVDNGEVVNAFEYEEIEGFVQNIAGYAEELGSKGILDQQELLSSKLDSLTNAVQSKSSHRKVKLLSREIKELIVAQGLISLAPQEWPNQERGAALFAANCASCHGPSGHGDGPASLGLQPAPTNFHDASIVAQISPSQAFNTISLGIEGTTMRSFNELSEQQVWDLSFYVLSLRHGESSGKPARTSLRLEEVATSSDEELAQRYPNEDISTIRRAVGAFERSSLHIARTYLTKSQEALVAGDQELALQFALKAYLEGVEPAEPRIKASDNQLFQELESSMLHIRTLAQQEGTTDHEQAYSEAFSALDRAEALIGSSERSLWMTALITLSILVREGLEAFFVILAILGILQSMNARNAIRWVHSGWIAALAFGIVGWFFADYLMSWDAQSRELMEGVIALFAVGVLLYLGFWMHGKSNAVKWKAFVENRVKGLLSRNNMIGLASFSFMVVFREAVESVLFLSSLTVDDRVESQLGVLIGTLVSAIVLFAIAWAMLRWMKRLPISKVFLYSSLVVLALAFVLAGEGIHAIQEGGYLNIRSFPINIRVSVLGLYPTYESILTQLLVFGLIVFLWRYSNRPSKPSAQ